MIRQIQDAYIVAAVRTPVGRARGVFATTRPDDLLAHVLRAVVDRCPNLDPERIGDVIVGCAMPEAEQGMNVARIGALLAGLPDSVPAMTINRFCSSGLNAVAMAADRIRLGEAEVVVAAGTESMSLVPLGGHNMSLNPVVLSNEHRAIAYGMGVTAEKVAERWQVSREDQDAFATASHNKALAAIEGHKFADEIVPYTVEHHWPDESSGAIKLDSTVRDTDEGPRPGTSPETLARLRPVFAAKGSVTAGNSSQMSDGAAALVLMNERMVEESGADPLARFVSFAVAGVPPEVMGIGPVHAIPLALAQAGLEQDDLDWIELNEAFAAQSLAVMGELDLDPNRVNPLGGAIALGHPLGATGAIRSTTVVHGLRRDRQRYGMVTMCIGTGMGAAGIFEAVQT